VNQRQYDYLILPVTMAALVVGVILSVGLIAPAQRSSAPAIEVTRYLTPVPTAVAQVPDANIAANTGGQTVAFDAIAVENGRSQFQTTCSACHGSNARGIPGLGKDLVQGEYVKSVTDEELAQFIIVGRQAFDPTNTTGVIMPARGGNPMLTDDNIREIVVYLRATAATELGNAPAEVTGRPDTVLAQPAADFVLPLIALGFDTIEEPAVAPSDAIADTSAATEIIPLTDAALAYNLSCAGCHGLNGEGTPNNGTPLVGNMLLQYSPDAVITLLTHSQPPIDPRVDFPHPMNGDYPTRTDAELRALVDYARTLGQ